jgi:predicted CXXCH cytochrome family protein
LIGGRKISILIMVILLAIASCTTERHYRLLSFFFDGVPAPDTIITDTLHAGTLHSLTVASADSLNERADQAYTVHYPYMENDCQSCHDKDSPGELVVQEPDLCYMCHDNFESSYKVIHGPVAGGYCTECHNPHQSRNRYMLKRNGQELCTWCHKFSEAPVNDMHTDLGDTDCLMCHNPHGGEDNYLIRE